MMDWDMNQRKRIQEEVKILQRELPDVKIGLDREVIPKYSQTGKKIYPLLVSGFYRSSGREWYKLKISVDLNFPKYMPSLYVADPYPLVGFGGVVVPNVQTNHSMHLWATDRHNHIKICHCHSEYWKAENTILLVLLKGFLWLEAFEKYRHTGEMINTFLPTMKD